MNEPTELPPERNELPRRVPRSRAELDITDTWARLYGDPGSWTPEVRAAYDNSLQIARHGGAA